MFLNKNIIKFWYFLKFLFDVLHCQKSTGKQFLIINTYFAVFQNIIPFDTRYLNLS